MKLELLLEQGTRKGGAPPTQAFSGVLWAEWFENYQKEHRISNQETWVQIWNKSIHFQGIQFFLISKMETIAVSHGCCGGLNVMRYARAFEIVKQYINSFHFYRTLTWKGEAQVAMRHETGCGASWVALNSFSDKLGMRWPWAVSGWWWLHHWG